MDDRQSFFGYVAVLTVAVGLIAAHQWFNRVQEFTGTLVDRREYIIIPGRPCYRAQLITPARSYGLVFKDYSKWRDFLDKHDGEQVIVRGALRKWSGQWLPGHLRIHVCDIQLVPATAMNVPALPVRWAVPAQRLL